MAKAKAICVQVVEIDKLKGAAHNPKGRTRSHQIKCLANSIERVGLNYPILVSQDLDIIDGHRRVAAFKLLGRTEIPVLYSSTEDKDAVYAEVNANARHLSSAENLEVYLANEKACTPYQRQQCQHWENRLGRSILVKLAKAGMALRTLAQAKRISTYVSRDDDKFVKAAALWLIRHRCRAIVDAFMLTQQPPKLLYDAVTSGVALKIAYAAK